MAPFFSSRQQAEGTDFSQLEVLNPAVSLANPEGQALLRELDATIVAAGQRVEAAPTSDTAEKVAATLRRTAERNDYGLAA